MTESNETSEEVRQENPEHLVKVKVFFEKQHSFAAARKERVESLMERKSAKKWKPRKIAKMVRRLAVASKAKEQTYEIIDNIEYRLKQIQKP